MRPLSPHALRHRSIEELKREINPNIASAASYIQPAERADDMPRVSAFAWAEPKERRAARLLRVNRVGRAKGRWLPVYPDKPTFSVGNERRSRADFVAELLERCTEP